MTEMNATPDVWLVASLLADTCPSPKGKNGCDAERHIGQARRMLSVLAAHNYHLVSDRHDHCDHDPIECSYDALHGEYEALRERLAALTAESDEYHRRLRQGCGLQ